MRFSSRSASAVLLAAFSALTFSACAPRHDVNVTWTVNGQMPSAELCAAIGPAFELVVLNKDTDEAAIERIFEAPCADGQATLQAGDNASLFARIVDGEEERGVSAAVIAPFANANGVVPTATLDVKVKLGTLTANLRIADKDCGTAGAQTFNVVLRKNSVGLDTVIVEEKEIACSEGKAVYENKNVALERRYFVDATASIGGKKFSADVQGNIGVAVQMDAISKVIEVSLIDSSRQSFTPDAGPDDLVNVPTPSSTVDAGVVDAGVVDAGVADAGAVDAGAVDAGAADAGIVDAGVVDAGVVDAGVVDAGVVDAGVVDAGVVDAG